VTGPTQVFTLDINGKPTLVFEASGFAEASEICLDVELKSDMCALTSDGAAICTKDSILNPRSASPSEIAVFQRAVSLAPTSDEPTMAFLIKIDGVIVIDIDPR
jgi:hypothetical protein